MIRFGITGHTGSLGRILIKNKKNIRFNLFKGDIRKKNTIKSWVQRNSFDAIIHLAAIVPIKVVNHNRKKAYEVNYLGTKNIVDEVLKNKIQWFFFSSTSHVYKSSRFKLNENSKKQPISYYGKTKLLAENYIIKKFKNKESKFCIGRIFSTANANQKINYLVPDLKRKIKKTKKKIILNDLNHSRDFISMHDISKIIYLLHHRKYKGIINIGTGSALSLKEIAKTICKKFKKEYEFKDNKKSTFLVADNTKLRKLYKFNKKKGIDNLLF
mgnify:CR=1 FL=1